MVITLVVPVMAMIAAYAAFRLRLYRHTTNPPRGRCVTQNTILDVHTPQDAVSLLKHLSAVHTARTGNMISTDDLLDALIRLFRRFPPTEGSVSCMSSLQKSLSGSGGRDEHGVCTVFTAMMISISEANRDTDKTCTQSAYTRRPRGTRSFPSL